MRFADLVGHDHVKEALRRAADRDRVPHAYLFHGPEGVGKRSMALALLSYLVCRDRRDGDSCGECRPCRQVTDGTFVDLNVLRPLPKEEEKAGGKPLTRVPTEREAPKEGGGRERLKEWISIQQMRDAMGRLYFEPMIGPWKCLLVDGAHQLTAEAANAALKTLEEPPSRSLFVLVTSTPDLLPRTIVSRCFSIPFGALRAGDLAGLLERRGQREDRAREIAAMARGRVTTALALAGGEGAGDRREFLEAFLALPGETTDVRLKFAEGVAKDKDDEAVHLDLLEGVVEDLVKAAAGMPDEALTNRDLAPSIRDCAERIGTDGALDLASAWLAWDASRRYAPNTQIALDRLVVPMRTR